MGTMENTDTEEVSLIKGKTTIARTLPSWLWMILAKSLGITEKSNEAKVLASFLYFLTFASASITFVLNTLFSSYDIVSEHTRSDILDGAVSTMLTSFFCGLGVYSQSLAYRLLVHSRILKLLRLHSKKVVMVNSAMVIGTLLSCLAAILNISTVPSAYQYNYNYTYPAHLDNTTENTHVNPCQVVELPVVICQVLWTSQMIYSIFFFIWNLLIALVLVSVCRTQTINIRLFLKELEKDANIL